MILPSDELDIVYKELPGWNTSLNGLSSRGDMPVALKEYISFIEERTKVPVIGLSYGPDREETLFF